MVYRRRHLDHSKRADPVNLPGQVEGVAPISARLPPRRSERGKTMWTNCPHGMSDARRSSRLTVVCLAGTKDGALAEGTGRPKSCGTTGEKSGKFPEATSASTDCGRTGEEPRSHRCKSAHEAECSK